MAKFRTDDLSLNRWRRLTAAEREGAAKRLAMELPSGFAFRSVSSFELGDQRHEIALFEFEGARFALIPGGPGLLGPRPEMETHC